MCRPYQILLPLLSLLFVRVDLTDLFPLTREVQVLKIFDGDTLLVRFGHQRIKLRLSKIDSPEKGQPFLTQSGDAGKASRLCLEQTLKNISSPMIQIEGVDIYGRSLGDLSNLSYLLIQNGCTSLYPYAKFTSRHEKMKYLRALQTAKKERRGLWKKGGYLSPKIWRSSKKHKSS